jgi:hypothetical protein
LKVRLIGAHQSRLQYQRGIVIIFPTKNYYDYPIV